MQRFRLSSRLFSEVFWSGVLQAGEELVDERASLSRELHDLEKLRAACEYNTGSVSLAGLWCLYAVARYFEVRRTLEVGTFIGRSAWAVARAIDHAGLPAGEVHTCDMSNAVDIPYPGPTSLVQYRRKSSTAMLGQVAGSFDFAFLDGRLTDADVGMLAERLDPNALIALDDFEGTEKGVINAMKLKGDQRFKNHFLVYPPSAERLAASGFASHSLVAVLLPSSRIALTNQG